jgi:pimeloyl-ACP methyl ester carboxylesterase
MPMKVLPILTCALSLAVGLPISLTKVNAASARISTKPRLTANIEPKLSFKYRQTPQGIIGGQITGLKKPIGFTMVKPFDHRKPTTFFTHGFIAQGKSNLPIARTYAQKYPDRNVVVMDWGSLSTSGLLPVLSNGFITKEYAGAADQSIQVGRSIGALTRNLSLNPKQVTLIGHSLGARASQYAAADIVQKNGSTIKHLILLDPAGPGFQQRPWDKFAGGGRLRQLPQGRLADKAVVVHTSKRWGDETRQGDIDVYVKAPLVLAWQIDNHLYANKYWYALVRSGQDQKLINSTAKAPFKPANPKTTQVKYR